MMMIMNMWNSETVWLEATSNSKSVSVLCNVVFNCSNV
jgi:hypothetical protein